MPHSIKRDYTFEVDPNKLVKRLRQYMPDIRAKEGKLLGTYKRYHHVKILFPDKGTRLSIDSKINNLQASKELEAIIKSCKRNH